MASVVVTITEVRYDISGDLLKDVFSRYGPVLNVQCSAPAPSAKGPGLTINAVVQFAHGQPAQAAIKDLHGRELFPGSCTLSVQLLPAAPVTQVSAAAAATHGSHAHGPPMAAGYGHVVAAPHPGMMGSGDVPPHHLHSGLSHHHQHHAGFVAPHGLPPGGLDPSSGFYHPHHVLPHPPGPYLQHVMPPPHHHHHHHHQLHGMPPPPHHMPPPHGAYELSHPMLGMPDGYGPPMGRGAASGPPFRGGRGRGVGFNDFYGGRGGPGGPFPGGRGGGVPLGMGPYHGMPIAAPGSPGSSSSGRAERIWLEIFNIPRDLTLHHVFTLLEVYGNVAGIRREESERGTRHIAQFYQQEEGTLAMRCLGNCVLAGQSLRVSATMSPTEDPTATLFAPGGDPRDPNCTSYDFRSAPHRTKLSSQFSQGLKSPPTTNLFIAGLHASVSDDALLHFFAEIGFPVLEYRRKGPSTAILKFGSVSDAVYALVLSHGRQVADAYLRVMFSVFDAAATIPSAAE